MGTPSPKSDSQQGLLFLMTSVVLFMGGLVTLSLVASNPKEEGPTLTALARAPASLVGLALTPTRTEQPLLERTSTLEVPCESSVALVLHSEIRQLRLKGSHCEATTPPQVENLTNGYLGTTFTLSKAHFATDFIHLAEGENQLRLTRLDPSGQSQTQDIRVVRSK